MKAQYLSLWRSFVESSKYQIYISRSHDPFINLSVEHFLLQKSPPNSTILFLYVNRPCVVIGRNQNPWLEVDLKRLREDHSAQPPRNIRDKTEYPILTSVELVRRRSGGGTVFHDHGNVNYSVICPTANFTRDKHAEMVTKAIREINPRARVNGRHDIVLDQGGISDEKDWPDPNDMHRTAFHHSSEDSMPLKVSGSAYKMTRQRSLHHGTCLLASANIFSISQYLRSPASPFMKARGVESVRSPIGNVSDVPTKHFIREFRQRLIQSFATLYGIDREAPFRFPMKREGLRHSEGGECVSRWVDSNLKEIPEINDGIEELKSPKWLYGQTPQFTLSSHTQEEDDRERPPLPNDFPASARVYLKIRSGLITSSNISISPDKDTAKAEAETFHRVLKDKAIQEVNNFHELLHQAAHDTPPQVSSISRWLNTMFGKHD